MTIAVTARQRDELNGRGFTILESLLTPPELSRVSAAVDEVAGQCREETRSWPPGKASFCGTPSPGTRRFST